MEAALEKRGGCQLATTSLDLLVDDLPAVPDNQTAIAAGNLLAAEVVGGSIGILVELESLDAGSILAVDGDKVSADQLGRGHVFLDILLEQALKLYQVALLQA